jgi:flagellar biosynthetic protein FliQ
MTPQAVMDLARSTLMLTAMLSAPLLLVALLIGLVVGMLQAATSINEATLSFIPKILVVSLTLFAIGPWMIRELVDFTHDLYSSIPGLIG